jgi:hypothetical protein
MFHLPLVSLEYGLWGEGEDMLILLAGINYTSWALVNWIFNGYIKKNFFAWWTKYNVCIPASSSHPSPTNTYISTF